MYDAAALTGSWLESGTIEVKPMRKNRELYIVEAGKGEWDHFEVEKTAKFTLELNLSDS